MVDFSVHQIRDFNVNGFTSADERSAIVILEYYEGITVQQHLAAHWEALTNELFRDLLCQIMNGLKCLHEEGIWHRNVHPDCFVLELPNAKAPSKIKSLSRSTTSKSAGDITAGGAVPRRDRTRINKPLVEKINVRVGECLCVEE